MRIGSPNPCEKPTNKQFPGRFQQIKPEERVPTGHKKRVPQSIMSQSPEEMVHQARMLSFQGKTKEAIDM